MAKLVTLVGGRGDGRQVEYKPAPLSVYGPPRGDVVEVYTPERYWLDASLPGAEHWRALPGCTVWPATCAAPGPQQAMLCVRLWATAERHVAIKARMDDPAHEGKLRRAHAVQLYPTGDPVYDQAVRDAAAAEVTEVARMMQPGWDG